MATELRCAVCNYDMFDISTNAATVGMTVNIPSDTKEGKRMVETFGKSEFRVCCVCMAKTIGIKPLMTEPLVTEVTTVQDLSKIKNKGGRPKKVTSELIQG